jgi:hypothetical protein
LDLKVLLNQGIRRWLPTIEPRRIRLRSEPRALSLGRLKIGRAKLPQQE